MEDFRGELLVDLLHTLLNKRLELRTVIGQRVWTSVKIHGLYILANDLQSRLHKFNQNLVCYTEDPEYQFQLVGSATGLFYRGKFLLICTSHQTKGVDLSKIGVLVQEESRYFSSAGFSKFTDPKVIADDDAKDLCVLEFSEQARESNTLGKRFFSVSNSDFVRAKDDVVGLLAFGCPFESQNYDVLEEKHLGLVARSLVCEPQEKRPTSPLATCKAVGEMDFDPNGMSGGPVFATVIENEDIILKFAGIICRAGNGNIHYIEARTILNFLDLSLEEWT